MREKPRKETFTHLPALTNSTVVPSGPKNMRRLARQVDTELGSVSNSRGVTMFGRNLWFIGVLVAAIALPYYMSGDSQWTSLRNVWNSMWTDAVDGGPYARPYAGQSPRWPSSNESMPIASGSPAPAIRSLDPAAARPTPLGSPADTSQFNVGQQRNAGNPAAGVATENATGATDAQKQIPTLTTTPPH